MAGAGAIFSSSTGPTDGVVTTILGGLVGTVTVLPLSGSTAQTGVSLLGGAIDLTTYPGIAQPVARDLTVTSIAAYFSSKVAPSLVGTTVTLTAQLYTSPTPDNTLTPVAGASCTMSPPLTGIVSIGTVASCLTTGLNIPVTAGSNAVVVISADATGINLINTVTGGMSASVAAS